MVNYPELIKEEIQLADPNAKKVLYTRDVLEGSRSRVKFIFDNFERISLSVSGGKDSSFLLSLMVAEARRRNKALAIQHGILPPSWKISILYPPNQKDPDWVKFDSSWIHILTPEDWNKLTSLPGYTRFSVFTLLWEQQYQDTVHHIVSKSEEFLDVCIPFICAVPCNTYNSHSSIMPEFCSYDERISSYNPETKISDKWIIPKPVSPYFELVSDGSVFKEYYTYGDYFETFVPNFHRWLQKGRGTDIYPQYTELNHTSEKFISCSGMRAIGESLSRWAVISNSASGKKARYETQDWISPLRDTTDGSWTAMPIYPCNSEDDFVYFAKIAEPRIHAFNSKITPKPFTGSKDIGTKLHHIFNHRKATPSYPNTYNLYYQANLPVKSMRIDEALSSEGNRGIKLYSILEPGLWNRMIERCSGVHSSVNLSENNENMEKVSFKMDSFSKPANMDWHQYFTFLMKTMPQKNANHYMNKAAVAIHWANCRGYRFEEDPENYGIPFEDPNDIRGLGNVFTWKKICYSVVNGDFWMRWLSFSPLHRKNSHGYSLLMIRRRLWWGIFPPSKKLVKAFFGDSADSIMERPGFNLTGPSGSERPNEGSFGLPNDRKSSNRIALPDVWKGTIREEYFNAGSS